MNYAEIQSLYGTPLSQVARPHTPFKFSKVQVVLIIVGVGFAAYGIYTAFNNINNRFVNYHNDKKSS